LRVCRAVNFCSKSFMSLVIFCEELRSRRKVFLRDKSDPFIRGGDESTTVTMERLTLRMS
jgi:hypothetical protein